jgi:hypothetical protein
MAHRPEQDALQAGFLVRSRQGNTYTPLAAQAESTHDDPRTWLLQRVHAKDNPYINKALHLNDGDDGDLSDEITFLCAVLHPAANPYELRVARTALSGGPLQCCEAPSARGVVAEWMLTIMALVELLVHSVPHEVDDDEEEQQEEEDNSKLLPTSQGGRLYTLRQLYVLGDMFAPLARRLQADQWADDAAGWAAYAAVRPRLALVPCAANMQSQRIYITQIWRHLDRALAAHTKLSEAEEKTLIELHTIIAAMPRKHQSPHTLKKFKAIANNKTASTWMRWCMTASLLGNYRHCRVFCRDWKVRWEAIAPLGAPAPLPLTLELATGGLFVVKEFVCEAMRCLAPVHDWLRWNTPWVEVEQLVRRAMDAYRVDGVMPLVQSRSRAHHVEADAEVDESDGEDNDNNGGRPAAATAAAVVAMTFAGTILQEASCRMQALGKAVGKPMDPWSYVGAAFGRELHTTVVPQRLREVVTLAWKLQSVLRRDHMRMGAPCDELCETKGAPLPEGVLPFWRGALRTMHLALSEGYAEGAVGGLSECADVLAGFFMCDAGKIRMQRRLSALKQAHPLAYTTLVCVCALQRDWVGVQLVPVPAHVATAQLEAVGRRFEGKSRVFEGCANFLYCPNCLKIHSMVVMCPTAVSRHAAGVLSVTIDAHGAGATSNDAGVIAVVMGTGTSTSAGGGAKKRKPKKNYSAANTAGFESVMLDYLTGEPMCSRRNGAKHDVCKNTVLVPIPMIGSMLYFHGTLITICVRCGMCMQCNPNACANTLDGYVCASCSPAVFSAMRLTAWRQLQTLQRMATSTKEKEAARAKEARDRDTLDQLARASNPILHGKWFAKIAGQRGALQRQEIHDQAKARVNRESARQRRDDKTGVGAYDSLDMELD